MILIGVSSLYLLANVLYLEITEDKNGMLECWNVGMLECWNDGKLEYWNDGLMECWNDGLITKELELELALQAIQIRFQRPACHFGQISKDRDCFRPTDIEWMANFH